MIPKKISSSAIIYNEKGERRSVREIVTTYVFNPN